MTFLTTIFSVPTIALFWTPGGSRKGPMKQDLSVLLSGRCFGIVSLVFSKFWHGARNPFEVMHDSKIFHKRIGKMGQKQGFLNLLKDVINFYWICSIMKIISFLFAMFPHKSYIWEKKIFLRYGPKYSKPIRWQDFLINHTSRTNQWNSPIFLHVYTNSHKLKVDQKFFGWAWPEISVASLVTGL